MDPVKVRMYRPNLKSVALPVPDIIAIGVFGAGRELRSNLGYRGRIWWSEMVPSASVSSYRPLIVTFPLSLRVSEILPLLCSSTPLFPTPPLVPTQNFHKFPWEHVDGLWATKSEGIELIVRGQLVSKLSKSNLYDPDPPTLQTDRKTDGQTDDAYAIARPCFAL